MVFSFVTFIAAEASFQAAGSTGVLDCNGVFVQGVNVSLFDKDFPAPDDYMDSYITRANGKSNVGGYTDSRSQIKPIFKIYHKCNRDQKDVCSVITVPAEYITEGKVPKKYFDAGKLRLAFLKDKC